MATIEFYLGKAANHIAVVDDGAVPRAGEYVSIRRAAYLVERVTWAVDHADRIPGATLRACVELVAAPKGVAS